MLKNFFHIFMYVLYSLHLHLVILHMLLSRVTYNWGIKKRFFLKGQTDTGSARSYINISAKIVQSKNVSIESDCIHCIVQSQYFVVHKEIILCNITIFLHMLFLK